MRNLLAILARYSGFFVFVLLEIISFVLIIRQNTDQQVIFLSSANFFSGKLYEKRDEWLSYFSLSEINDSLANENAQLKAMLLKEELQQSEPRDTFTQISDSTRLYQITAAKVINNSITQYNNYLTINKGRKHGIKKDLGVLGLPGVIGIVREVSENYAQVMSILHHQCRISAKIKRNDYFGYISWPGKQSETVFLNAIPKHISVQKGDSIVTSGFSTIFPPGVFIGTIKTAVKDTSGALNIIEVNLANDLQNIQYVYIVDHLREKEVSQLEQSINNAD